MAKNLWKRSQQRDAVVTCPNFYAKNPTMRHGLPDNEVLTAAVEEL